LVYVVWVVVKIRLIAQHRKDMGGEEVAGVVYVVDVEHDEARWYGIGGLAGAVAVESASVRSDDGKLAFEASELVGITTVEELDLIADGLDLRLLHSKLNG
jgi:hypothetical protein